MAVNFKSQTGVRYLSTTALTWYGDILTLNVSSSWHIEAVPLDISSSWNLLNDLDQQSSWHRFGEINPESSWNILTDKVDSSSWNILNDFSQDSSWSILLGFDIQSSWELQGVVLYFPVIDVQINSIKTNFKAHLKRELNINAPKVYTFYNRTEKVYEFKALRQIKRKS